MLPSFLLLIYRLCMKLCPPRFTNAKLWRHNLPFATRLTDFQMHAHLELFHLEKQRK